MKVVVEHEGKEIKSSPEAKRHKSRDSLGDRVRRFPRGSHHHLRMYFNRRIDFDKSYCCSLGLIGIAGKTSSIT